MLKSMTGFGRGEYTDDNISLTVEIRAVNHRYNEIAIRLPRLLNPLEDRLRKQISERINRGRVDVFVNMANAAAEGCELKVDQQLALAYNNALEEITRLLNLKSDVSDMYRLNFLSRANGVISARDTQSDAERYLPFLSGAAGRALDKLLAMRASEGDHIHGDLLGRLDTLAGQLAVIEDRAPLVVEDFHRKLRERVGELLKDYELAADQDKILREVALFADRSNVTEEIVRLKSHIGQFRDTMGKSEPVGRKLDFIVQEFNREVNTIASKANDYNLTEITIEMKSEIEKIREQIQNIE